jgi:hypothetical protein
MTVNAKITQADYNSIRNKLDSVIGTGSASFGWGQTVVSSAVNESTPVAINEWGRLRFDIINAHTHIFGTTPTTVQPALGNTIKSDIDSVTFNGSISETTLIAYNQSGATSMLAIGQTLTSGGGTGRSIIASINNLPITITSFTSKTLSSGSYLVEYAITAQPVALPFGNNTLVTISGNSNTNYNGTVPITASTTTSITVQYSSDPDKTNTTLFVPAGSSGTTLKVANTTNILTGQTISGTGFTSGLTVVSIVDGQTLTISGTPAATPTTAVAIDGFNSKTLDGSNYLVKFNWAGSSLQNLIGTNCVIAGNSNTNYNGTYVVTDQTSTSVTLQYATDPGTYGTGATTATVGAGTLTFSYSYGTGTTTVTVTPNNPWGYSTWTLSGSGTVAYSAMTAANSTTRHPITQYDEFADTIVTNRFTVHPSQSGTFNWPTTSTAWPGVYGSFWSTRIQTTVTATWSTATNARHFFNSGGEIRFVSSRSGGGGSQQNLAWTSLLNSAGMQSFGARLPISTAPTNGRNWFQLTSSYQEIRTPIASSTPYGSNSYRISARTPGIADNSSGTAATIEFLIEWRDNYVDPDVLAGENELLNPPGDRVDGTFALSVSHLFSTGILEPAGTGNFTVQQPSISVGTIAPA